MNNYEVAHKFFYDLDGSYKKDNQNVWYINHKYYSYGTIIGKVVKDLNGDDLLLVSENNFSKTTSKHLNQLLGACPFDNKIFVPVEMWQREINTISLFLSICGKLDFYKNSKLSQKQNRDNYIHYYKMLLDAQKLKKIKKFVIKKYEKLYLKLIDVEKVKELKKQERIKDKKAIEKAKKEKEKQEKELKKDCKALGLNNLCDYAKFVHTREREEPREIIKLKTEVRKYLKNNYKDFDFVWFEDDNFKTSKSVKVPKFLATKAIELYKNNDLKHGEIIDRYTVLEVKNDSITIGCHKFCRENLDLLIKELEVK